MNAAEKIASTYLRLNGFLLLPHFTVFARGSHNHVDLVGLRAPNSGEVCFGKRLPSDPMFDKALASVCRGAPNKLLIGLIAEVRSNKKRDEIRDEHVQYVREFLGGVNPLRLTFFETPIEVGVDDEGIAVGLYHAFRWIHWRIAWMEDNLQLSKLGSWTLSEEFLADLLSMKNVIDSGAEIRARAAKARETRKR